MIKCTTASVSPGGICGSSVLPGPDSTVSEMPKEENGNMLSSRARLQSATPHEDSENRSPLGAQCNSSLLYDNMRARRDWCSDNEGNNHQHLQHINDTPTFLQKRKIASTTKKSTERGKLLPTSAFSMLKRLRHEHNSVRNLHLIPPQINHNGPRLDTTWLKLGLGITELAGEAGSGKSQMAMSLCVQAVLNFQRSGFVPSTRAIYISLSGGQASISRIAHRMQQMAEAEAQHRNLLQQQHLMHGPNRQRSLDNRLTDSNQCLRDGDLHPVLSQILTRSVRNQDDLFSLLRQELPELLEQQQNPATGTIDLDANQQTRRDGEGVALIVLDSIADLFRLGNGEEAPKDNTAISSRSLVLFELASILKKLSSCYNVPVLVINQISASLETNASIPTLGLSWENCVNTSYLMRRQRMLKQDQNKVRQLFLTKSANHSINRRATFQIEPRGIAACMFTNK